MRSVNGVYSSVRDDNEWLGTLVVIGVNDSGKQHAEGTHWCRRGSVRAA